MRETEDLQNVISRQIEELKKLQSLDSEIREIEKDLVRYPEEASVLKNELRSISELLTEKKLQAENFDKSKSLLETELNGKKQYIEKTEERLLQIKTHREYEALQKELTDAKRECLEIEEQILDFMEKSESSVKEAEGLDSSLKEKSGEYEPKIEELEKIAKELREKCAPLKEQKDSVIRELNSDVLPVYEKISKRTPVFLSLACNEMCTDCNMNIPPQMFNEVLMRTKIIQCPNCNRILYFED